ncbi:MAG: Lrp/AsnC ligand binding domain-containing protein [Thaumarchaeota archaeon]|nr:Lrp/AsnC ligand binding domain-containing protein [Nitrososphaerota archaeon]
MAKAFVLINCELGSEEQVISDLKSMDCVKDVYGTFGAYDILANLECDNIEDLRQLIVSEVRRIKKIRSTITLMGITE